MKRLCRLIGEATIFPDLEHAALAVLQAKMDPPYLNVSGDVWILRVEIGNGYRVKIWRSDGSDFDWLSDDSEDRTGVEL